ncbi:MAG: biotin--[acetyl-CoA-carboxylase] ligase [Chloroflexi bacterium]|nr:MAG: biotin--[acetyl-CoA-carboxylase] ligase [Chloroflexota bacterium]
MTAQLSGDLIRNKLPTYTFGQNVIYTKQTGSTNTDLKKYARSGAPEGMLVATDEQLVGRGRLQRSWMAPAGSGILASLLFRPDFLEPAQTPQITMLCALAMLDAIAAHTHLEAALKWPNDIVWHNHKKLAGLLTETEFENNTLSWVVVGLGLNVNVDFSSFTHAEPDRPNRPGSGHPPLAESATSLSMILEKDTDHLRLPILQHYLKNVEQRYIALKKGVSPHFEWQRRLIDMGQPVTVHNAENNRQHSGVVTGVNENGGLRLRQPNGSIVTVLAGDVTLR